MDPELQALLAKARAAMGQGKSVAHIDSVNKAHGAPTFADLVQMEKMGRLQARGQPGGHGEVATHTPAAPVVPPITGGDVARTVGQGATMDWLDEMLGAFGAFGEGGDPTSYTGVRDYVRGQDSAFQKNHPDANVMLRGAGAAIPAIATAGALPGAAGLGVLPRLALEAGIGAGMGGVQGAGEANTVQEMPSKAGRGAALGSAVGLSAGAAVEGVTRLAPGLARALHTLASPEAAGKEAARRAVKDAAERAGLTRADFTSIMHTLENSRPGMPVPADADDAFRRLLRASTNDASGNAGKTIQDVAARAEGAGERMAQDARQLSGVGTQSTEAAQATAKVAARAEAKQLYGPLEQKYAVMKHDDPYLNAVINNIDVKRSKAWQKVRPESGKGAPGFVHFQALKQELDDEISSAFSSGRGEYGNRLKEQRTNLVDRMEQLMPGYMAANREFAKTAVGISAFEDGSSAWARKSTAQDIADELTKIQVKAGNKAPEAVKAYRLGLVNKMADELLKSENKSVGEQFVRGASKTLTERGKAAAGAFDSHADFQKFIDGAIADNEIAATARAVRGNSTSAAQLQDMGKLPLSTNIAGMLKSKLLNFTPKTAARSRANTLSELLAGRSQSQVADILGKGPSKAGSVGIAASGMAPAGITLWDYLNR